MHKIMRIAIVLLVVMLCVGTAYADEGKLSIVCTSFPCYDFVRAVAGDAAEIRLLIKPGAEVHTYEPTPSDIMEIAQSDLFVYIGGESDVWVDDILESFGTEAPETLRFFDCVDALEAEHGHENEAEHGYDEHIWTSPENAILMVRMLGDKLCEISPEHAEAMRYNAEKYMNEIGEIDAAFESILENAKRREMIFADRFPFMYFAYEYGLEWRAAFESCSSESEPSAKTMMSLIDSILRDDIPVIYTIELSNQKTAKTIASETGVEICTFHSVQNVTEEDFSNGESYVSLMQKNVAVLEKGLN